MAWRNKKKFRVVELYAGTGRSLEPFRRWRRAEKALLVDADKFAASTYRRNFPTAPYAVGNLKTMPVADLINLAKGSVDVLVGCPPCQGFSESGKRDADDPRNYHITRFCTFALALRPLAIGMENVPLAAISPEFGRMVRRIEAAGYCWTAGIANAALYGSGQSRQRLIFIAVRGDVGPAVLPTPTHGSNDEYFDYSSQTFQSLSSAQVTILGQTPALFRSIGKVPDDLTRPGSKRIPTIAQMLDGLPPLNSKRARRLSHVPFEHTREMLEIMSDVREGGRWDGGKDHFSHAYGRLHRRGLARTVTTYFGNAGSGRFWHPTENRALTVREAARLQGFPDSFRFYSHEFVRNSRLVGNALDSALAEMQYEAIRQVLE